LVERRRPYWVDPETIFVELYSALPHSFWLDSGFERPSGCSYIGAPASESTVAIEDGNLGRISVSGSNDGFVGTMFDYLRQVRGVPTLQPLDDNGLHLGRAGWFGYECGNPGAPPPKVPTAAMMEITQLVVFEHASRGIVLRGTSTAPGLDRWFDSTTARIRELATQGPVKDSVGPGRVLPASLRHSKEEYLGLIQKCQDAIHRGDAYQLCLTNEIDIVGRRDPVATYRRLRRANPSHHGGYIRVGDVCLLSSSPEQFLKIDAARTMWTRPIKGTRPRGVDSNDDALLRDELASSEKERAGNVMIVDLMRNDLGRVAVLGTVTVPELFAIETYTNVFQLVSTVTAQLDPDFHPVDAIRVCFPAGSMTGTPKISAMATLAALEKGPRGIYAGAFGYVGLDGQVDLAVTIRSIVMTPGRSTIGTGGGITALSNPEEEFEEIVLKAAPLLAALGAELGSV
jgi:para-aminobenzoate synthetase component 1